MGASATIPPPACLRAGAPTSRAQKVRPMSSFPPHAISLTPPGFKYSPTFLLLLIPLADSLFRQNASRISIQAHEGPFIS